MKKIVLFDIDYTLFDTDLFRESELKKHTLYEEVVKTLGEISEHADLGIFSEGDLEFQRNKLLKTDIMKHFNEQDIHIFPEKKALISEVFKKYEGSKIFLIDDRPSILKEAKKAFSSIFTIFIDRKDRKRKEELQGYKPDASVETLSEIIPFILNS